MTIEEFMEKLTDIVGAVDDVVWGPILIVLILATGIYLTCRVKCLQIRRLPLALKYMWKNEEGGHGEISSFAALCTALSATVGTGNIVGVATALAAGGPGALFWMLVAAFFGMATKYSEGLLAIKYRVVDDEGHALGGPFYYIENGMGHKWKWLAKLFAFFGAAAGLLGIGTITQIQGISSAIHNFFDPADKHVVSVLGTDYSISIVISAVVLTILIAMVLIGGIKRISSVSQVIVPVMIVIYVVACLCIIIFNITALPHAIKVIITEAFKPRAVIGGGLGGLLIAMQKGIARGIFSNEAGLGSAPIAAAAAQTNEPVRQGLVTMTGTFIDTIIVCTMTGLSIVMTGAFDEAIDEGLEGVAITTRAFSNGLPVGTTVASFILMVCLVFFAFSTVLGWNYYGERCVEYLTGKNNTPVMIYRVLYIVAVFVGPFLTVSAVWGIADIFNGLMAIPNLIALLALSGVVAKETKDYFDRLDRGDITK
jgi:AGCS family alanine or glycine:cation symporter